MDHWFYLNNFLKLFCHTKLDVPGIIHTKFEILYNRLCDKKSGDQYHYILKKNDKNYILINYFKHVRNLLVYKIDQLTDKQVHVTVMICW